MFAGSFYPRGRNELQEFVKGEGIKGKDIGTSKVLSMVVPHAGYVYSGTTALLAYKAASAQADGFDSVVIIGPNHTGMGLQIGVSIDDWRTPLGEIKNDSKFAHKIIESGNGVEHDELSHREEHSIEVQLPFVQYYFKGLPIVPICMGNQSLPASKELAKAISASAKELGRKPLVIASSDFDHYEPAEIAKSKDFKLIKELEALNPEHFNLLVNEIMDSTCGYGPTTVAAIYAKSAGSSKGILLKYSNSGDVTKDYSSVVAYASIVFV